MQKKRSLVKSLGWIVGLVAVINLVAFGGMKRYLSWKERQSINYKVAIKAIIQTGPQREALKTAYLAEILDLSIDRPLLTSEISIPEMVDKLLSSPVIRKAEMKVPEPGILYIDYTTYQPLAFLYDYENVALDGEKTPFPMHPFYSPKKLPQIYLGLDEPIEWNQPIQGEKINLAFTLLDLLSGPMVTDLFHIQRIDVSKAFEKSLGRQEIVLILEDEVYSTHKNREIRFIFPRILRLSVKYYPQDLTNYLTLRKEMLEKEKLKLPFPEDEQTVVYCPSKIIDFRISQLAFIDELEAD